MNEKTEFIVKCLNDLLAEKGIISRYELLQQVYRCVRDADLALSEKKELEGMLKEKKNHIAPAIFFELLSGDPVFSDLPRLDSVVQVNDVAFHFEKDRNYGDPDFARASKQYQDAQEELSALVRLNLKDLLVEFMEGAGYDLVDQSSGKLTFANAKDERLDFRIFATISEVEIVEGMEGSVVIVPHSESPEPFIAFFREKGVLADEAEVKVWVANMEAGTIDPFIGYPKDMEIYKQFNNPRLALMVKDHWGRRME